MEIRIAKADDVAAMFEVRTSVHENHMSLEELAELDITPTTLPEMLYGTGRAWVAYEEDVLLAFAMADANESTVFALFVRPGYEGRGIGRCLMDLAEQWLHASGCTAVWLVTDHNTTVRANGFYRHLGWQDDGMQEDGQVRFIKHFA